MATKLTSAVIRETSTIVEGREIVISLNEDQSISLKRKGMKSGTVFISIAELWDYLQLERPVGNFTLKMDDPDDWDKEDDYTINAIKESKKTVNNKTDAMISLQELRTLNAVTTSDPAVLVRIDEVLVELLKKEKV